MSREFEIRSDDAYSQHADRRALHAFLSTPPNVRMLEDRYGEYEDPELDLWMPIHLVLYDKEGNLFDDLDQPSSLEDENRVNAVQLHISAGWRRRDDRDQRYVELGFTIADYLGWRMYDCERGRYLDPEIPSDHYL